MEADEIKWDYNSSTKTVVISGEGPMRDYLENAPEWDKYSAEAERVVIGDKVTSVGAGAFIYFSSLTDVDLGNTVEFIGEDAFSDCEALWTVNFPENLKYVGDSAFNNESLHSEDGFTFPEGMLFVGTDAFRSAFKENTVSIPGSLSIIGDGAFANTFVSAFHVDENNPDYASVDGVLYTADSKLLLSYPIASDRTEYTVLEGCERICDYALSQTKNLTELYTNEGLQEMGSYSVYFSDNLTEVRLPKSLITIDNAAFLYCDALTRISFAGSGSDWE